MLTVNELAANLAELTGCSIADAENFLREVFALAVENIEAEGEVDIPCLGRFVLVENDVVFKPDAALAEAINAPFADFEPVELPDGFSLEETAEPETPTELIEIPEPVAPVVEPADEISEQTEEPLESEAPPKPAERVERPTARVLVEDVSEPERRGISPWWLLLTAVLFFVAGFFFGQWWQYSQEEQISDDLEQTELSETPEPVEIVETDSVTEPVAPAVMVLDTISSNRFLTTMARRHYNQFEYWVYIYEANASRLGNPDRLEAGTVVVIPSADSLGLKVGDPEKIYEALLKAEQIYNRFN